MVFCTCHLSDLHTPSPLGLRGATSLSRMQYHLGKLRIAGGLQKFVTQHIFSVVDVVIKLLLYSSLSRRT